MQELEKIKGLLKKRLSAHRFKHTESVAMTAIKYARIYEPDIEEITEDYIHKIEISAWLHDCCKELKNSDQLTLAEFYGIEIFQEDRLSPNLLHARIGRAWIEEEFDILDPHILHAVRDHTFGSPAMFTSSKIVFLADMLEPNRDKNKASKTLAYLRALIDSKLDLDAVVLEAMNSKIKYVLKKNHPIHPLSIQARNAFLAS